MIAPLVALLLGASTPRPLPGADLVLHAPRIDKLPTLNGFLDRAGSRSGLLRPNAWRADLSPVLEVDFTQPSSVQSAGIDPASAVTASLRGDERVSCVTVKDRKAFEARAAERLVGMGKPWKAKAHGAALVGVTVHGRVTQGYLIKGREACTADSPRSAEALLREAAKALGAAPAGGAWSRRAKLPGVLYAVTKSDVVGLRADGDTVVAQAHTSRPMGWPLARTSEGPYAKLPPEGLLFTRFKLGKLEETAEALRKNNLRACRFCDAAVNQLLNPLAALIAQRATGHGVLRVDRLDLKGSLGSEAGQYFALRNALLLELSDAKEVEAALARLASAPLARRVDGGWALTVQEGELRLGLLGRHLYVANDERALKRLLDAMPSAGGAQAHAAEWVVNPARLNAALGQVNLLDIMGSRELAALFAVGTEVGPLLSITEDLRGWAEPAAGGYRLSLRWDLR